jgi:trimeric autotransporter adhesin
MNRRLQFSIITLMASLSAAPVLADNVSGLTTFTSGAQARAAEVNANYQAIKRAVDDNFSRIGGTRTDITALQAAVAALQTSVQTLSASNTTLQSQVATLTTSNTALQASVATLTASNTTLQSQVSTLSVNIGNLSAISPFVELTTVNGARTIRFSGVNLQVVNGLGSTATANGTGNMIVGYDEVGGFRIVCSRGKPSSTTSLIVDATACTNIGGTFSNSHKSGSHYLVTGAGNNYSRWGGIVSGQGNYAIYDYASVVGGMDNISSGNSSMVSGGHEAQAVGDYSSISGGRENRATGQYASVTGGRANVAAGESAAVSGGELNTADGFKTSIAGGLRNYTGGFHSSVTGGGSNTAVGNRSNVSGGSNNTASGADSHVSGGAASAGQPNNQARADKSSILGGTQQTTTIENQTIPALP